MFTFIIILVVLAILAFVLAMFIPEVAPSDDTIHPRKYARRAGMILVGLTLFFFLIGSIRTVGTKDVGIETTFGRTSGELSNGFHLTWPWVNVTSMDAAIQTDSYTSANCLSVRIANQQTACVHVSIRWRIIPTEADSLFQNYRTFDNVRDSLVTRELVAAVNNQLSSYNPLNSVEGSTNVNPPLSAVALSVTAQMRKEIGSQIDVINTIIPILTFDAQTQSRINQLQQQIALTRIAQQEEVTNQAQSVANQALASSVNTSPNVLVAECLSILSTMVKNGQAVPAGFSCWPGGGVSGVIANASTTTAK